MLAYPETKRMDGEPRSQRVKRVASVVFAAVGGIHSLAIALPNSVGTGLAAQSDAPVWTTSGRMYVSGDVLVDVVAPCDAWVLLRRPRLGGLIALAAAGFLLLVVALFPITSLRAHLDFWAVVAVPLLLASGLGMWRAVSLEQGVDSRCHQHE